MPKITFRGVETEDVKLISQELIEELSAITGTPASAFTLEVIESVAISNGRQVTGYPFVEVCWFDRPQDLQNRAAAVISTYLKRVGCDDSRILFTILIKNRYYKNGELY